MMMKWRVCLAVLVVVVVAPLFLHQTVLAQEADYGDLPESYESSGTPASHILVAPDEQLRLGNEITSEPSPQYSGQAFDDADDGVILPGGFQIRPGNTFVSEVTVAGIMPPEGALLGVWIDWDESGTFSEDEFLAYNLSLDNNSIPITAPDDYEACQLFMRFRLFAVNQIPGGTLDWEDANGGAINGEVEDYSIPSVCPTAITLTTASSDSPTLGRLLVVFWGVSLTIPLLWHKRHNNRKRGSSFPRTMKRTTSMNS